MKKTITLFVVVLLTLTTSCDTKEPIVSQTTSTLTISYDLTSPLEGTSMTKASSKADIFSEFYTAIKSGELMSPTYDLTFTEVNTGESFRLQGKWNHRESLAIKMGTYNVTGNATAEGEYIQEFCSVVINTSNVVIDQDEATLSLKASYDCALVIFADESIESVVNHTAGTDEGLFVFSNYIYAFVNDSIWDKATLSYLCGTRENGSQFTISTSGQPFEKGKFYIYDTTKTNSLGYLVDIPEMEEGEIHIQPLNEIWYTSTDCEIVTPYGANVFGANIISNTYKNGKGVIIFDGYVTSIGNAAFSGCSSLASITIPDGVTLIGNAAFFGCSSLASITIPDSVTSIGELAFHNCGALTSITIPEGVTEIGYQAFYGCSSLVSVTIPDSVTSIGGQAFDKCSSLESITIPEGVTSIGEFAFYDCTSLTSITIPDSVTEIGWNAFSGCSSLASITILDGVTSIGESAFYGCSSLVSITIPDSVTSIGWNAFRGCSSLTSVYCKSAMPHTAVPHYDSTYWRAFNDNASGRKIYVPEESVEAYKTAEGWSEYADAIVGYDFE